jgi:DNA-binding LacI/PurR family transcriptional regulator/DNA-binding FadR family transcriptional regulator
MNAIQQAYGLMKKRLHEGVWARGERLPPLSDLAKMCFVSRNTMWKALDLLKKDSLVSARQGGAIIAGTTDELRTDIQPRKLLWEEVKTAIGRQILSGSFGERSLPPTGKLALRLGVDSRTIKKALQRLVDEGLLTIEGRRYIQSRGAAQSNRRTVLFISAGNNDQPIATVDPRTHSLLESYEREAVRYGDSCRSEWFDDQAADCCLRMGTAIRQAGEIAGFILSIWNPWDEGVRRRWFDLIQMCVGRQVPVIVIDLSGDLPIPDMLRRIRSLRILQCSSRRAGELVAEALLRCGHKRIAYITSYPSLNWSKERYSGMKRCFEQYGGDGRAAEFVAPDEAFEWNDMRLGLLHLGEKGLGAMLRGRFSEAETLNLLKAMKRLRERKSARRFARGILAGTLHHLALSLANLAGRKHDSQTYSHMLDALMFIAGIRSVALLMNPVFAETLKTSRATAWVCSEDATALAALTFLRSRKEAVPDRISVVGFDNWFDAYAYGLSSFDFNMNGMIQQALLMISDDKFLKSKPVISEVDGYVVERRTTGAAPPRSREP